MISLFKKPLLGIDLGERSLRIVSLKKQKKGIELSFCAVQDLQFENLEGVKNHSAFALLAELVETHRLKKFRGAFTLPDSRVSNLELKLPMIPQNEVPTAILNELEVKYQIDQATSCIDWTVEQMTQDDDASSFLLVKVFVASKSFVEESLAKLAKIPLKTEALENSMNAIAACLAFNSYLDEDVPRLVIDLGVEHSSVGLFKGPHLLSYRSFPVGTKNFIRPCVEQLQATYNAVELQFDADDWNVSFSACVISALTHWSHELSNVLLAMEDQHQGVMPKETLLVGAGSRSPAFMSWLSNALKMPIKGVDPYRNLILKDASILENADIVKAAPYMSVAVGLALREVA